MYLGGTQSTFMLLINIRSLIYTATRLQHGGYTPKPFYTYFKKKFKSSRFCAHTDRLISKHKLFFFSLILTLINQSKEFYPTSSFVHSQPHLSESSRTFLQLGIRILSLAASKPGNGKPGESKLGCRAQRAALRTWVWRWGTGLSRREVSISLPRWHQNLDLEGKCPMFKGLTCVSCPYTRKQSIQATLPWDSATALAGKKSIA